MAKRRTILSGFAAVFCAAGVLIHVSLSHLPFAQAMTTNEDANGAATTAPVQPPVIAAQDIGISSTSLAKSFDEPSATGALSASKTPMENTDTLQFLKLGCPVVATAKAAPLATVDLSVDAPCQARQIATVHYGGLMFSAMTDENGILKWQIPVFAKRSAVIVEFPDGAGTTTVAEVPTLQDVDRIALQWKGKTDFQVRTNGPSSNNYSMEGAEREQGSFPNFGHFVRLGDSTGPEPRRIEIYTFPARGPDELMFNVETEITHFNCNRSLAAQTLELRDGQRARVRDIVLTTPSCAAVGDFLVLNFPMDDLMIASR